MDRKEKRRSIDILICFTIVMSLLFIVVSQPFQDFGTCDVDGVSFTFRAQKNDIHLKNDLGFGDEASDSLINDSLMLVVGFSFDEGRSAKVYPYPFTREGDVVHMVEPCYYDGDGPFLEDIEYGAVYIVSFHLIYDTYEPLPPGSQNWGIGNHVNFSFSYDGCKLIRTIDDEFRDHIELYETGLNDENKGVRLGSVFSFGIRPSLVLGDGTMFHSERVLGPILLDICICSMLLYFRRRVGRDETE